MAVFFFVLFLPFHLRFVVVGSFIIVLGMRTSGFLCCFPVDGDTHGLAILLFSGTWRLSLSDLLPIYS